MDLLVASVLQAVARAQRWVRLEELLQGPFAFFAHRFVQLLEWGSDRFGCRAHELTELSWSALDSAISGPAGTIFENWDRYLWGDVAGGAVALFPILEKTFAPLAGKSVTVHAAAESLEERDEQLLALLIEKARLSEGVAVRDEWIGPVDKLRQLGLPLRIWANSAPLQPMLAGLVGSVRFLVPPYDPLQADGFPVLTARKASGNGQVVRLDRDGPEIAQEGLWTIADEGGRGLAFLSIDLATGRWPTESDVLPAPEELSVPGLESLRAVTRPRSQSAEADQALQRLGRHLLYGPLLQMLLIEALDRELGYETLTFAACLACPAKGTIWYAYCTGHALKRKTPIIPWNCQRMTSVPWTKSCRLSLGNSGSRPLPSFLPKKVMALGRAVCVCCEPPAW